MVLIGLLSAIQANIPVPMFELSHLTPGVTVFGLSFLALFSSTLLANDRESALLRRLYATPLSAVDFIFGYILPILPMAMGQSLICYLPVALFYISLGPVFGSLLNPKQVGGIQRQP